jgi:hypothetical protein
MHGSNEYEIARRILRNTILLANEFSYLRAPGIQYWEFPDDYQTTHPSKLSSERKAHGMKYAYEARWKKLQSAWREYEKSAIDGEVVWGLEFFEMHKEISSIMQDTRTALEIYLEKVRDESTISECKEYLDVIAQPRGETAIKTPFTLRAESAFSQLRIFLTPHIVNTN